jgi:hypothetical protein
MENHYFECQCSDFNHIFRFVFDPEDGEMWLEVHLNHYKPWYKRLVIAFRYFFKRVEAYGHYDVTMIREEDLNKLQNLLTTVKSNHLDRLLKTEF